MIDRNILTLSLVSINKYIAQGALSVDIDFTMFNKWPKLM